MPRLTLQPDSENGFVWVTLDGQRLVPLRDGDREGLKVITTWLVDSQIINAEEAAAVGILLKQLQHRVNLSAFGGGEAHLQPGELEMPDEKERQRLLRNRRQVATRQANDQARLREVERELERLRQGESSANGLGLGVRDLNKLIKELKRRIQRATARLKELNDLLNWADGKSPRPEEEPVAELDLTRESILTQLKLEVFTAKSS